ncbi:MAG: prolipoprotein diacylglyceryl transferase [Myxococcaceae bacterium]
MSYFHWNSEREMIHLFGFFGLRWYTLFFLCGFLTAYFLLKKLLHAEGKDNSYVDSLLNYMIFGTLIGARLGHCLFYDPSFYMEHPLQVLAIWEGGLASHGGYLGILVALIIFCRQNKLSFLWLTDRVCIFSVMAGGFIRLGNLFNSEIVGHATSVPWAIVFDKVDQIPRHPAQIYESIGYFSIAGILYAIYRWGYHCRPPHGYILGFGLILSFTFRFFIEFLKENQSAFENQMDLNMGQILSIPFVITGIIILAWTERTE